MSDTIISIDGSHGEGGGQILRSSVGLAAALGLNIRLTRIRAGRPKPGLRRQHLTAVKAAAAVCGARVTGDRIGSTELSFSPAAVRAGAYRFDVGTAGSTMLVLQTVIPALMLAAGDSAVTVTGGTHNPFAPCFQYVRDVFAPLAAAANLQGYFEMARAGFYPAGGGEVRMEIRGLGSRSNVSPIRLVSRGELKHIEGISAVSSRLSPEIAERQCRQMLAQLAKAGRQGTVEQAVWEADCPGTVAFVRAVFGRTVVGFSALGERGKPAERVADEAVLPLLEFLDGGGAVDAHAADQLVTIAALSPGQSALAAGRVSEHLLTNAEVIRRLTGRKVTIDAPAGQAGSVIIEQLS